MKNKILINCVVVVCVLSFIACNDSKRSDMNKPDSAKNHVSQQEPHLNKSSHTKTVNMDSIVFLDTVTLSNKLQSGELSALEVTQAFLDRIAAIDDAGPMLNAVIDTNPDALDIAKSLDEKFKKSGSTGILHGIPVLLKANIDTNDRMATSAGSMALQNHYASEDAPLVANLRAAGAVILGKTNLSEWANFRSTNSSSGWSSVGGLTKNPYVLDRNACGSSSGSGAAVSAFLAPLAVGTETDGSVICPSSVNGVVGIKPTVGRVSGKGIIPISVTQDTAGPMATTVAGAELLYQAMHGLEFEAPEKVITLQGVHEVFDNALKTFENAGAELIDNINLEGTGPASTAEYEVLLFEFKDGLNKYLQEAGLGFTLENLIDFNKDNSDQVLPHFAQEIFDLAQAKGNLESPEYKKALQDSHFAMQEILNAAFGEHNIDVLIAPSNQPAWPTTLGEGDDFKLGSSGLAAISGYPNMTVPMGNVNGLPVGLNFIGLKNKDEKIIEIARQFEALTQARIKPKYLKTLN